MHAWHLTGHSASLPFAAEGSYPTAVAIACYDDDAGPHVMGCPHSWSFLPGCTAGPFGAAFGATGADGTAAQHCSIGCDAADTSAPHITAGLQCCERDLLSLLH